MKKPAERSWDRAGGLCGALVRAFLAILGPPSQSQIRLLPSAATTTRASWGCREVEGCPGLGAGHMLRPWPSFPANIPSCCFM